MKSILFALLFFTINCEAQSSPPDYFAILRWFSNDSFPKIYNGWRVKYKTNSEITGYTEGYCSYQVDVTCDTCGYLLKYSHNIYLEYGVNDEMILKIVSNKDTTHKYFMIEYPGFPASLSKKRKK